MDSTQRENSISGEADFETVEFPPQLPKIHRVCAATGSDVTVSRTHCLGREQFESFMDSDGRLVNEHALRKAVFRGGVAEGIRKEVWQFLFGLYPFTSTHREREAILADYHVKYHALKERWMDFLKLHQEELTPSILHPVYGGKGFDWSTLHTLPDSLTSQEALQQLTYLKIQAKLSTARQKMVDLEALRNAIRFIDKDTPRTDRDINYFSGDANPNLLVLRNILITFAAYHPDVTYAQGMNDILSRFLTVFDSEVEAYWCFINYMENIQTDFIEAGMLRKLGLLRQLLRELDPDLYSYLEHCGVGDLAFCHRWVLLQFKREFPYEDALKVFEIVSSHHLELSSMEAEKARNMERRKDFELQEGKLRTADVNFNPEFTFELIMTITILLEHRQALFNCADNADVFQTINRLTSRLKLDDILVKSEALFFKYCRKSVADCFHVIDTPSAYERKLQKR